MAETALSQINVDLKRCAMVAMRQMRRITKNSFPRHAPSSRGCAGSECPAMERHLSFGQSEKLASGPTAADPSGST